MLQTSPNDAQNVKVWNTLIQQCMSAGKYKLAYSLFVDMGRRGFKPSFRTYGTTMSGYARIEDWSQYSKQLENVDAVYQRMIDYLQSSRDLSRSERPTYLFPVAPVSIGTRPDTGLPARGHACQRTYGRTLEQAQRDSSNARRERSEC
ncbi:hypothetical protein EWM64_g8180 [Hericium alpestre]|uniref:Pentacotripeptide-repeat region of PRORP domain-containing protein n=1 Tax=Hericium alpestre TaxID=135208 RepID=A0A4Y9ZNJ5_9AGAM|nr:hypothetical protein EWM64_g8180 [Hericium alpestre]